MGRSKLKFAWIVDRKARNMACQQRIKKLMKMAEELTILGDTSACLTCFNRDDGKMVAWPSQEEAKSLIERFNALPAIERYEDAYDPESYIKAKTEKIEKRLEHSRKVVGELEMNRLMLQLQNGRMLADLSQTEVEKLKSYASKKITDLTRELGAEHPYTSVDEPVLGDEIPKARDVAPEGGPCFRPMASGSVYLMDQWFFDTPEVQMETNEGESSKSGGADDA